MAELPSIPTIAETMPGFVHTEWFAMVAPPKTPPAIASTLSQAVAEILALPDVAQRLRGLSVTPVGSSPEDTATFVRQQSDRWRQLIGGPVRNAD
jgi:tripartite-type tricarboxylate transporter receptor subunit TctC